MKPAEIPIAIVGAGRMAREHLRAFSDIQGVRLAGIFSRSRPRAERLAEEFGIACVADSIDELHSRTEAELAVITVPEMATRAVCLHAFQYPWMLLIEKPVGYNLAEAEDIALAARQSGRQAFVALNRRHYESTLRVLEDLAASEGQRLIHVCDQEDPQAALAGGQPSAVVKYWMYANSVHLIDYFLLLGRGEIDSVEPVVVWDAEEPRFVISKIHYSSGDVGIYEAIWNGPGPWSISVSTHARRWELKPVERASVQVRGSRKLEPFPESPWDQSFKPGFRRQAAEAIKALRGEATTLPSLDESLKTMKLIHAIYGV